MAGDHENQLQLEIRKLNDIPVGPAKQRLLAYHDQIDEDRDPQPSVHRDYISRVRQIAEHYDQVDGITDIYEPADTDFDENVNLDDLLEYLNSLKERAWLKANAQKAHNDYYRMQSTMLKQLPVPAELGETMQTTLV